jgi:hypothetical protein
MKFKPLFAVAGLTAAIGLSLAGPCAQAQGGGRRGGFGAGAQGGGGNVMQMMMGGGGSVVEPARSAKAQLVYRPEVQIALGLDLKQKNALDALVDVQRQNGQKMGQDMRTLFQGMRGQPQPATPEERQQKMQEMTDKAKGIAQGYQDDIDKRIDEILTPKQRKRLSEIDLRWRGPMALVDPKVADQAAIGAEDKQKAQDAYKAFTDARQTLIQSMMPAGFRNRFAGGAPGAAAPAAPAQPAPTLSPEEQAAAQKKALRNFEKSRKAMGVKLVAALSPAAATAWQGMIGAPFTFRDND